MRSYVVIGGGLAGLTAANALAVEGHQVTLMEQSKHLGGCAQTQQHFGYSMNLGPHALYCGGVAFETFRTWQIPFTGNFPPSGPLSYFVREEKLYPLVRDIGGLAMTRLFGVREKLEAGRFLSQLMAEQADDPHQTMHDWLKRRISSQHVYDFAVSAIRTATYAIDMTRLNATAALRQVCLALKHKVLYLDGGWQTMVEGLRARAISLGVQIRCEQLVRHVDEMDADGIVLAVGPASVEKLTGITLPKRDPLYMATLDLGLEKLPENAARVAFGLDKPLYFSVHSESARLAAEGSAMIHVAKYFGDSKPDAAALREELEDFATLLIPEWRRCAQITRFLPNLLVTSMAPTSEGRPDVDFPDLENVVIAGDWVGPEGMLADAAVASALRAAQVIQKRGVLVA
ncbi:FAD-dependent oxidoreductase [Acidobacterium sp. S8]|uniref:FAD-dependent oxidoreductase n=1 Tax=Acidobacterium sp. S8 TaxID=1641854 RepID=UPI00131C7E27|nr:FAD-dependent oxidoreductase [Acidobacterium sp. S8]